MMIRNFLVLKSIALFMMVNIVFSAVLPTLSFALSSSPTQPEYSVYESPDNTDMVNLLTGDFVYNIPLLTIPGPEGSFPIPLSYNAGISPDQDASWVGLGWTLNAGAITRSITQFPDDFNGQGLENIYEGTGGSGYSINALIFSFNHDSETGNGGSIGLQGLLSAGYGTSQGSGSFLFVNFEGGKAKVDAVGLGIFAATVITAEIGGEGGAIGAAAEEIGTGINGLMNFYSIASLASNAASDIGKFNSKIDALHISRRSWFFYSKYKYWFDFDRTDEMYGPLYFYNLTSSNINQLDDTRIWNPDEDKTSGNCDYTMQTSLSAISDMHISTANVTSTEIQNLANPVSISYDNVQVMGPGISGSIKPYRYDVGSLAFPAYLDDSKYQNVNFANWVQYRVKYKYDGDNSNYYNHQIPSIAGTNGIDVFLGEYAPCAQPEDINWIVNDQNLYSIGKRMDYTRLSGTNLIQARNVEWYPNEDIESNTAKSNGFIDFLEETSGNVTRTAFRTGLASDNGIGGYSITRPDGMTFHYALPVYNASQTSLDQSSPGNYNQLNMNSKYAYQWLLTAVTGPDYVDRNTSGTVDQADWGYWVKLEYGMFNSQFNWRNPYYNNSTGASTYSLTEGVRESYYLNSISTRSHTALFIKDLRNDGKGAYLPQDPNSPGLRYYPSSSLMLTDVILLNNKDYQDLINAGLDPANNSAQLQNNDTYQNVLDKGDIQNFLTAIYSKQIKRIQFHYDYSLCNHTLNSFPDPALPPVNSNVLDVTRTGKLTLLGFSTLGANNQFLFPDYGFDYNQADPFSNPDYSPTSTDEWGMYVNTTTLDRDITGTAWSLQKITTPLGSTIGVDYERDEYSNIGGTPITFAFNSGTTVTTNGSDDLASAYAVGDQISYQQNMKELLVEGDGSTPVYGYFGYITGTATITSVSGNTLVTTAPVMPPIPSPGLADGPPFAVDGSKIISRYGGNLRVKQITVADASSNVSYKTTYGYDREGLGVSSGVISQDPAAPSELYDYPFTPVLYGRVVVSTANYSTEYAFQTPDATMISMNPAPLQFDTIWKENSKAIRNIRSYNYLMDIKTASVGNLLSVRKFDQDQNVISQSNFQYDTDNETTQGLFTEGTLFGNYKEVQAALDANDNVNISALNLIRTTKTYYPNFLKSITTTQAGITSTVTNTGWDFYTGEVLQKQFTNSLGQAFTSVSVPAYTQYTNMGSKAVNPLYANMFSQKAANYLYKGNGTTGTLVSAGIQTWSNAWNARTFSAANNAYDNTTANNSWRKKAGYAWSSTDVNPDGTFNNFTPFTWWSSTTGIIGQWLKTSEVTQYDEYSKPTASKDVNGNFASTKYGYDKKYKLFTVSNSNYVSSAYTGFEKTDANSAGAWFDGEVSNATAQYASAGVVQAHTGMYVAKVAPGDAAPAYTVQNLAGNNLSGTELLTGKKYRASVWLHTSSDPLASLSVNLSGSSSLSLSATAANKIAVVNNWQLLNLDFFVPANYISSSAGALQVSIQNPSGAAANAYFDDLRLHPLNASLTANVYDDQTGLVTHTLDANNFYTKYEYDNRNRLQTVYKETAKGVFKVKDYQYKYSRE